MRLLFTGWLIGILVLLGYPQGLVFWLCVPLLALPVWALLAIATPRRS
ncbi:hypothetical protein [Rhodoferax sp.]